MNKGAICCFVCLTYITISACTFEQTKYSEWGATHVSETGPSVLKIIAHGNNKTPRFVVESFALLRAAEETLKSQATKFLILDDKYETMGTYSYGTAAVVRLRRITITVKLNKPPHENASDSKWLDAQAIVDEYGPRLKK